MSLTELDRNHTGEQLASFESLLIELSTHFINLPANKIDSGIENAQRRICESLDLDLSTLWQWSQESSPSILTVTHLFSPPQGPSRPERINALESFPWQFQKLLTGETLAFSTEEMPPEAAIDQESRRFFGIKSSIVIPLCIGDSSMLGVLTFDTLQEERAWPVAMVNRLKLVAQIFSNAIARKDFDKALHENEIRLRLAADSAGAGLWELNFSSSLFWVTERGRALFGYGHNENITMERFEKSVLGDDLARVRQVLKRSLETGEPLDIEYRIEAGDGELKWIRSSARPYFKLNGAPDRLLGVSVDITERKTNEAQLKRSEERLVSAIDIAELGFYEMVENYHFHFLDDRIRQFLGIPPEDEAGVRQFWMEHIHPDDLPHILNVSREVLEKGVDRFAVVYRYVNPRHGMIWLYHLARVLKRDVDGRATHVIGVVQDITERKTMEEKLRGNEAALRFSQKDLRRLAGKLISIQEDELRGLSRELHDDLSQRLAVLAIDAGMLQQQMQKVENALSDESVRKISQFKEQLIQISENVHKISRQLHPTILDDLGLVRAMESECAAVSQREGIEIVFCSQGVPEKISSNISLCLYRITQEGLKNIVCHSNVNKCEVCLKVEGDALCLTVTDEGVGFDPVVVRKKPGLGLTSMHERVLLVEGDLFLNSSPGKGTTVRVEIPLANGGS